MINRKYYEERQTSYANAMEQFGLIRGLKKSYRSSHTEIKELMLRIKA